MLKEIADTRTEPCVSVVIPCRNEVHTVPRLLDALVRQVDAPPFEVVVIDGASDDGTRAVLETWQTRPLPFPLIVVDNPARIIPCALNLGVRRSSAPRIVRLDAHGDVPAGYLKQLYDGWLACGAEVVGPHIRMIAGGEGWWARVIALMLDNPVGHGGLASRRAIAGPQVVEHAVMSCFTRETWEVNQGFDEGLLVNEDFDFDWRAVRSGRRVMALPAPSYALRARAGLRALAIQRWRYGWWKAVTLRRHPTSLRLRQLAPLLGVVAVPTSVFAHPLAPLLLVAIWSTALMATTTPARLRAAGFAWWARPFAMICVPVAAAVSQGSWALGCWAGLLLCARPRPTVTAQSRP